MLQTHIELVICKPECGVNRACIPKCCDLQSIYNAGVSGNRGCYPSPWRDSEGHIPYFNPPLYKDFHQKVTANDILPLPHFYRWTLKDFRFNCEDNRTTFFPLSEFIARNLSLWLNLSFHSLSFKIREDGTFLYTHGVGRKCMEEKRPEKVLCIDGVQDYGGNLGFRNIEGEYGVHLCTTWNVQNVKVRVP